MARFAALRPGEGGKWVSDFAADEIGLIAGWTTAYAGTRLATAVALVERLPATLAALEAGKIDSRRAERLVEITKPLSASDAAEVEAAVLPEAEEQNSAQLARAARKAVAQVAARDRRPARRAGRVRADSGGAGA